MPAFSRSLPGKMAMAPPNPPARPGSEPQSMVPWTINATKIRESGAGWVTGGSFFTAGGCVMTGSGVGAMGGAGGGESGGGGGGDAETTSAGGFGGIEADMVASGSTIIARINAAA